MSYIEGNEGNEKTIEENARLPVNNIEKEKTITKNA
jgi:hypothetical protein